MDTEATGMRAYLAEQSKRALALLLCCTVTWTSFPAWAQVAPTPNPGGQTPGQQVAANGVPVVDIVAPNARGISHNRYSNFNVGPNGLILNNSAQISKTELGGYVAGNDNLQRSGAASLILNEVTSASSRLQGYTEIAGAKAQLVIANPNGISCDGCGFLNTSRVTLTTGTPNLGSDGALNGFSITGGALGIGSNGLDAFNVDRLDLLSRQLSVEGSIWTRELVAAAGVGQVNYDGMLLEVVPGTDGAAPSIGIDVAQLGGMYADRIRLIATEAGVGVVSRGTLAAQSGDLQIDSAGQVSLGGTTVARDGMGVRAAGDLDQRGVLGSQQGDVRLRGARMTLAGDLVAAGTLDAQASGTLSHSGRSSASAIRLFGSELNADGSLHTTGALDLGADGVLRSNGVAYAATAANLRAGQIGLTGTLQSGGAIGLNANAIDALGILDAATALRLNSSGDARLGGLAQTGQGADVRAGGRLELQGQLIAADTVALDAASIDIAQRGAMSAGGDLELRSVGALNNAGSGYAGRDLRLQAASVTTSGSLAAARDAQAAVAGSLVNSGTFVAGNALTVDAAQLDSRGDIGSQRGETLLRSRGGLALSGNTVAGTALGLDAAADAQVSGIVNAGRVNLRSGGDAALSGTLQTTAGGLVITAGGELVSDAVVGSTGTIDLQANGALRQRGQLRGDGAVQLRGAEVEHNGVIDAGGDLRITSAAELALDGTVQSAGSATLQAGAALQNRAKVIAAGALDVEAASLRNAQSAAFSSDAGARVRTAGTLDNAGSLYAASDLQLTAGAFTQSGSASSGNTLSAAVSGSFDNAGTVIARNALKIDAGSVRSSGQLGSEAAGVRLGSQGDIALQGVVAVATTLQASAAGDLQQAGSLRAQSLALSAGRDLTAAGNLQSASTLDLQAQRALTFAAQGQAGGDASMRATTLTTSQDAVLQSTGAIALDGAAIDSRGKLDAGSDLQIRSQGDLALAGVAQGGRDVGLNTAGALSNAAQVFAGRDLSLQAGSLDNTTSGVLAGEGNIALTTTALLNNAGRVQAGGDLQINAASVDQGGSASAGNTLHATIAGTLDNRGNLIAKDALQVDAATLRSSGQLGSERADVTLNSRDALQLEGVVAAATALRATAGGDLQQAGSLKAQSIALQAGRDLTANGTVQSASTLDLQAQRTLALNGHASSTGEATVTGASVLTGAAAVLQSGAAITLDGGSIDSRGSLDAATDLNVHSAGDLALAGLVQGGRDLALSAAGALNNGAQVVAARDLHVQAASANSAATATLGALRDLRVDVAGVLENNGSLHGERGLALNTGTLLQRGRVYSGDAVSIASTGAFENAGQLVSGKDLTIAADSIVSSGQLGSVDGALTLTSQNAIDLHGVVAAATTLQATAGTDLLQAGSLNAQAVTLQAGRDLTAGGTLQSASVLDLQAQRSVTLNGQAQAGSDANLRGNSIATGRDAVLKSVGAISLDGAAIDSRGTLDAGTDLRLRSTGALALAGVAQANRDVVLSATDTLSNASQVIAGRELSVQAGNINNVAAGVLAADGSVTLTTGALQNAGSLQSGGDLRITAANMDQGGTAIAGKALTAKVTGTLDNRGNLIAKDALQVETGSLRSSGQLGSEAANVSLISQGDMTLQGVVAAATTLQATAVGDLQQAGSLKAQSIALQAGRDLTAAGTLQSATQLDLQAQRALTMNGQAVATGDATLRGAQIGTGQAAVLQSGGAISLDAAAIDSRGALDAATDLNLRSTGDLAVAGVAQADRNVVLGAAGALTNAAQVVAGQSLNVTAASASNAASGVLLAQGDATVAIGGLLDNAGAVRAGNQLALGVGSLRQTGQAYGLQRLGVIATGAVDNRGDLIGGNGLRVEAAQVSSSGQLGSERGDVALISRGNLELGGSLASAGSFSAQADGALAQSGTLSAGSTLELRSKGDLGVAGQLGAQQVTLTSDAVLRQQGTVSGTTVGLQGASIENAGQTTASGNLSLRAGEISIAGTVGAGINADGSLGSGRTLSLIADRQLSASGKLLAGGNLTAQGSQLQLAGASTRATGNVALTTGGNLDHRGGDLLAGGTLTVQAGGNIDNGLLNAVAGQMQANQLSIDGASLSNAGGRLVQSGNGLTRISIGGATDNTGGTLASNAQDLTITAASLENAQGRIEHAGTGVLSVTSRSALGNSSGRILTQGQLHLDASGALNNQGGAIAAAGDAALTVAGLNNIGGSVSARGLNVQSTGAADNRNGLLQASGGALTLRADSLSNAGGIVQAVANAGAGGSLRVELNRGLDNGNGTIGAGSDAVITAENISSSGGSLQAARDLSVTARGQLDNHQGGKLSAGRDLNVAVAGALLNSGGQLDAGNTLTASGGLIDNTQGSIVNNGGGLTRITTGGALTNSGGNLGGRGSVVIDAASIANNSGQLVAGGDLIANTTGLNNQSGNVYAGASFLLQRAGATLDNQNGTIKAEQAVRLNLQNLNNAGGKIGAGSMTGGAGDVVIDTVGFDGGGSILAQNLLDLTLRSDYTHRAGADLTSNGTFNLRVGGSLVNESTLKAARSLDITAGSITNRAGATILSNDTRLNGGNIIDNAGSISGNGVLSLVANSINNTGSIVGGNVSVNTGTLVNGADFGGATDNAAYGSALLGSTGYMNLIVRDQLLNRDARIFSLGNIAIGGAQDGGGTLVSRTGVVNNLSGSIEADGSILIAANQLNNRRRVINTTSVSTDPGSDNIYSGGELIEGKAIRNLQGARAPYPYKGLAPGIYRNYQVIQQEQLSSASAEGKIAAGGNILLSGSVTNNASTIAAAGLFAANQRGLGGLSDAMINGGEQLLNQALALSQVVRQSDVEHIVTAITNDCMQPVGQKVVCYYEEEDQRLSSSTTSSSYVALGASMTGGQGVSINGANISNGAVGSDGRGISGASLNGVGAQGGLTGRATQSAGGVGGQAVIGRANGGTSSIRVATGTTGSAGSQVGANTQDATLATSGGIVKMSVAPVASNDSGLVRSSVGQADVQATPAGTGVTAVATDSRTRVDPATIPVTNIVGGGQTSLTQIDLPIGGLYRLSGGTGTDLTAMGRAANGLGGINAWRSNGPGRRYLIETDPRFVNYDNFISSDFLLDKLGVDPEWTQTRLGDGFYEQRLVLDQITQLTGRRYLGNYADGVAQYRALLESGVAAAGQLQLSMGVGLTAAQAAALTQDIVWMVEQDYQGQKVLVPVVYLASNSLQLRGNGALIAGGNVELNATNAMSNQGVIAGADVSITAGNLLNQGRISGTGAVSLEARNDLLNQGQIQGRDVALVAGNNLVSEASKAINGVGILSGISASNTLQLFAGNDMTLTGTRVQADGSAALIAGNNLSLTPSALRDDNGLLRGGDAVSVTTGKDLVMSAGNDLQLHGVTINAGGSAALQAGNNLSLTPTTGLDGKVATRTNISTGDSLQLTAGNDLTIRQADVTAGGDLIATAGNNLNVESVLNETETNSYKSRNGKTRVTTTTTTQTIDQQALTAGGNLILSAGNDVNLVAAKLDAGKGLGLSAGNDINASTLTTVDTSNTLETRKRFKQTTATSDETVYGTEFNAGGDLAMQAGNDITLTAASAATKEGGITLAAGNDVNLLAASKQHDAVQDMTKKKKGTFSSKTTTTHDEWRDNVAVTTTLSGDTVQIAAGNDLLSQGAQVASTGDVVLAAGNNITLDTVQNTHSEEHEKTVKKSGLYGGGGFSVALGVTKKTDGLDVTEVTNSGSLVGSTDGSVTMTAGNKVAITGSDVLSATSTTIVGKEVTIAAAENTVDTVQTSKQQSAGITLGLTGGVVAAAEAAYSATKRGSEVEDDRLKALYAAKAGYAVSDGVAEYQAAAAAGSSMGGVSLRIGIGASSASSKTTTHEETTGGSRILSDGDVTIAATGGDLNVIGSKINGENVVLSAANDLNLLSNLETNTNKSENKNAGGEIGVSVGTTTGVYLTAYAGKGSAKGNSDVQAESVVTANDRLTLVSGNDTTIKGAQAIGDKVLANVGGDLLIQSEQDTSDYKSKQQQAGMTLVWGFSGSSANYSQQKVNNSYTSVNEQSGIQAGKGGFNITVGGNTHLVGGAIASAADATLNRLSTDSLTVEDLQNEAKAKASNIGVGAGTSGAGLAQSAASAGLSALGSANSNATSITRSDIAAGAIEIRNKDFSALEGLERSASMLDGNSVKAIDTNKLQEQVELSQVAGEVGFRTAKEVIAARRDAATEELKAAAEDYQAATTDEERAAAAVRRDAAQSSLKQWSDGGNAKMATQVLAGVFQASLGGGSALGAAAGVAANEGFLTKLSASINKGLDGDGIAHEGAMNLASIGLGLIAGGLMGDATSGAIAANTSQQYGYYDYRDGKRQLLASDALREMAGGDEALLQGMRTLINEAIKNGADPASLAAALTTPGVASNMAGMALVEASAQKEYGKSFGALGLEDQKILLGMVGRVYVEDVQSIGPDGQPLVAVGGVEKLPTVEVVGKSSGGLLHAGQLVSGVIESGGRGVEKASNWLGQDTAMALAYVAMAAAGGPVKTVASTLFENSAAGEFLQNAKQQYLVDPFGRVIGTYGLGAQTAEQLQSVRPASSMMAGMGVDAMMAAIGATTAGTGAKSILESSQGIGQKIDNAGNLVKDEKLGGPHRKTSKPSGDGLDSHHCPAQSCYKGAPIGSGGGPAIKMDPEDHELTASFGRSKSAQAYRDKQKELLDQGRLMDAVQMDVDDIRAKFGKKYDGHIQQMIDYAKTLNPDDFKVK
ncbi:hemagglutinin repeat-containing protein [Xanthomonas campestris pv. campestris]|nr:hemagglutinin repeat-containing protein [Xanthomonas campestris pv. campestris]